MPIEESKFLGILGIDEIVPSDHEIIAVNADRLPTKGASWNKEDILYHPKLAENSRREVKYREGLRIASFDFK